MSKPPLWKTMQQAGDAAMAAHHPFATDELCRAAEILALRDWLVPEADEQAEGFGVIRQAERQRLRALLTAEANRAERGDKPSTSADQ